MPDYLEYGVEADWNHHRIVREGGTAELRLIDVRPDVLGAYAPAILEGHMPRVKTG